MLSGPCELTGLFETLGVRDAGRNRSESREGRDVTVKKGSETF